MSDTQNRMAEALMDVLGKSAWDAYSAAVGGKAYNGDPLPAWDVMCKDPSKAKIVEGWKAAGIAAVTAMTELQK